ncbi:MAG: hypothetical protein PHO01_10615 [Desulfotomaculaceae bacterium]|nr:hypothetical protein [Desulfotomaculaceae bacterium]
MGNQDHQINLIENVLKQEKIPHQETINEASESEQYCDLTKTGEDEYSHSDIKSIFEANYVNGQQKGLHTIILAFLFIIVLFFFRAKYCVNS